MSKTIKEKICTRCHKLKHHTRFYFSASRNKLLAVCKPCCSIMGREFRAGLSSEQKVECQKKHGRYLVEKAKAGDMYPIIAHKLNTWRYIAKRKNLPFNLDSDYLLKLFHKQEGRCYYSGVKLQVTSKLGYGKNLTKTGPNQFSLDRRNPKKGYVKGNVVWCTYGINIMKNFQTEKQFYTMCQGILKYKGISL